VSRSSRRVSRPLIAAVAAIIVLGLFFTIHKLRSAKAIEASNQAAPASAQSTDDKPVLTPQQLSQDEKKPTASTPPTTAPAQPIAAVASTDESALITQTPTSASPTSIAPPATQPGSAMPTVSPNALARAELPDLTRTPASTDSAGPASAPPVSTSTTAEPAVVSQQPLQDAKSKMDAGDLLASRQLLNDALISGRLSDADADAAKKQIDDINHNVVFSARKFANDPWGGNYTVASGERLATIAAKNGCTWELLSRVNGVTPKRLRSGQTIKIFKGPFYAIVYKKQFKMEIYLGNAAGPGSMYITSFPVGLGKDNSTPTGMWMCKAGDKIRSPRYYPPHGGDIIAPDDPKNPLGGYWIAIEGLDGQALGAESYGIHGTIDPDSIGKMESMGCIRLKSADISWVFDILVDGKSKVLIKD
jgi:hypothetical protein